MKTYRYTIEVDVEDDTTEEQLSALQERLEDVLNEEDIVQAYEPFDSELVEEAKSCAA
jgi:hypothetical protein